MNSDKYLSSTKVGDRITIHQIGTASTPIQVRLVTAVNSKSVIDNQGMKWHRDNGKPHTTDKKTRLRALEYAEGDDLIVESKNLRILLHKRLDLLGGMVDNLDIEKLKKMDSTLAKLMKGLR